MSTDESRAFLRAVADSWSDGDVRILAAMAALGSPSRLAECGARLPSAVGQEHPHVPGVVVYTPENDSTRAAVLAGYRAVAVEFGGTMAPPHGGKATRKGEG